MLSHLALQSFRNYEQAAFDPGPAFNLVVGDNGSGKTSLLEAIHVLATGRSFRTTRGASLIREASGETTLHGRLSDAQAEHRIGMRRRGGGLETLRLDGEDARSMGEVARLFPVQVFHPGTVDLVEGGPGGRRRFLDWGLFHVEPEFAELHRTFRQALGQRNRLLKKDGLAPRELGVWDRQLSQASDRIDQFRRNWLDRLLPVVNRLLAELQALPTVAMELESGWPHQQSLADLLATEQRRDQLRGFTRHGAHRADIKLSSDAGPVREVFSRGQTKSLAYVLVLAQLELLVTDTDRRCLILVDDLGSELDWQHQAAVLRTMERLGQQTIFTALSTDTDLLAGTSQSVERFHVEQGNLQAR